MKHMVPLNDRQNMSSKETAVIVEGDHVDSGQQNTDGLRIPTDKCFKRTISLYRVILSFNSVLLAMLVLTMICRSLFLSSDGTPFYLQESNILLTEIITFALADTNVHMDVLVISLVVAVAGNVCGWMGVRTLRMRFLALDLGIQCVVWSSWILSYVVAEITSLVIGFLVVLVVQTILVSVIIHKMRMNSRL